MRIFLGILLITVVFLTGAFFYYGGLARVTVVEREIGPFAMIYEANKGPYKQTGDSVHKLMTFAKERGVKPEAGFGMYFDDPRKVAEAELRSEAGIIVTQAGLTTLTPSLGTYQARTFPPTYAVVAEFPLRGFPSIMLGIWKVYPKIMKHMIQKGYEPAASMEIYDIDGHKTTYAFPLSLTTR